MTTIFIILLILSQLICFYFLVILNSKIAKFKDLEVRQDKLIREMDDVIGAYLLEMREENDRFISELSKMKNPIEKVEVKNDKSTESDNVNINTSMKNNEELEIKLNQKNIVPKNVAVTAYAKQKTSSNQNSVVENQNVQTIEKTPETFEQKVINLYKEGKSIEEIAKVTEKGKTEIELLLKFHT